MNTHLQFENSNHKERHMEWHFNNNNNNWLIFRKCLEKCNLCN